MEPYRIGTEVGTRSGFLESPPPCDDHQWHGVREFWSKSYAGAFAVYYDEGVDLAKADLLAGNLTNRDALFSVEVSLRDRAWEARRDGYDDTVRKNQ